MRKAKKTLLEPFSNVTAVTLTLLLFAAVAVAAALLARPGRRARLAIAMVSFGVLAPVPLTLRNMLPAVGGSAPAIILLGIDSVSQADDLSPIREWTNRGGGTWYERAVAPGLLTNAVWTSILTTKPVSEGVQAAYYDEALKLAACQPTVRGFLIFHVTDETDRNRWQSGVYYADGTPKASRALVKKAIAGIHAGAYECGEPPETTDTFGWVLISASG